MKRGNDLRGKNTTSTHKNIGKVLTRMLEDGNKILIICPVEDVPSLRHYSVAKYAGLSFKESKKYADDAEVLKKLLDAEKDISDKYDLKYLFLYGEESFDSDSPKRVHDELFINDEGNDFKYDLMLIDAKLKDIINKDSKYDTLIKSKVSSIYII